MASELTADAISKILVEKFPPKMVEGEGGEQIVDITDERTVQNSIIVSLARRVEANEKQTREIVGALKVVVERLAQLEVVVKVLSGEAPAHTDVREQQPQTAAPPPPPPSAPAPVAVTEEAEEEEGIPEPNVRSSQASNVMPNAAPAPNGSRS